MVFLLSVNSFLSLLLPYKKVKGEKLTKEVLINCNGFQLRHMKAAACTHEHNYETRPHL